MPASFAPTAPAAPDFPIEVVRRALFEARESLAMDAAFFAELTDTQLVLRALDGDAASFGWSTGQAGPLEDSYCARMIAGEIDCWVPDALTHPVTRDLPGTAAAGIGAYVGVPVRGAGGRVFGSLCCVSHAPRPELDSRDARLLGALAGVVASQLAHERRYQRVLEAAREPVWVTDLEGRTVFANEALASLLGVPREALAGRSAFDFLDPSQADRARAALANRAANRPERYELAFTRPDGRALPVEIDGAPLADDDGVVIGTIATLTDLTERKDAERLSEARFRWLADLVPQQVWTAEPDGRIDFVSARVGDYYGAGTAIADVSDWRRFVHQDDLAAVDAAASRRAAGRPYSFSARLRRYDGEYREHLSHGFPMRDESGTVRRWYGITTDLTGSRAQDRLLESEAKLREAQRIARLGSFEWDAEQGTMHYSDELLDLLGLTSEEFDGRLDLFVERVHPDDRERVVRETVVAGESGAPLEFDARVVRPDGGMRTVHVRGHVRAGAGREPAAMAGTIQDVTEQRAAELAVRGREDAERASRAKSDFLSRMSHELRTPLNAILGFGQLLELDPLTEDQRESVGHVLKAGGHLLALIDEVLEISRIEAGALRLSLEPVALADAVGDVVALVAPLAAERDIELDVDAGAERRVHVRADLQRVKQVLLNLLSNAIKYNRHGGRVTVRVHPREDGRVGVVVSDTGHGLRADQLERAFNPFERLGADGATEGTGLGLVLSRSLAEAMGGELTAASEPGRGADFTLLLDAAAPPVAPEPAAIGPAAGTVVPRPPAAKRTRVLCVEDNPSNLRLVERVLARAGVEVLAAPQGRLGIELARRHAPDLVLLDLDLPDIGGESVLASLAEDPATARIPVLICSADATPSTIERLEAAGASGYLTKPLRMDALLKAVAAATDGS